jgi:23S rRNA (cytosine1962-C5)-methyltransferase
MINEAARDSKTKLRLVEARGQAHDHPVLPASPETHYLKCHILQVMD